MSSSFLENNMKQKDLYLPNGYLNIPGIINGVGVPNIFIIGARGIGKTYGILEWLVENKINFLYLRRLQKQINLVTTSKFNPFKKLNIDKGWNIHAFPESDDNYGFYETIINEKGKRVKLNDEALGISGSLSTFSNTRGFDGCDINVIFYDEFVKEKSEAKIKEEADALFNIVETVNRNRELNGNPPCMLICASNSTDAANDIFMYLQVVSIAMSMQRNKENIRVLKDRMMCIIIPHDSPISEQKEETALYKMTKGTAFADTALRNEFVNNTPTSIRSAPLSEYKPLVKVGEICIYKHKSNRRYYVSEHSSGNPPVYRTGEKELAIFRRRYPMLIQAVYREMIDYETYTAELLFDKYTEPVYY